jgi:hypothetical protein
MPVIPDARRDHVKRLRAASFYSRKYDIRAATSRASAA